MSPSLNPAVVAATKAAGLEFTPGAIGQFGTELTPTLRARFGLVGTMLARPREKPAHREPAPTWP